MKQKLVLLSILLTAVFLAEANEYRINIDIRGLNNSCQVTLKDFESTTDINKTTLMNGKGILQGSMQSTPRLLFLSIFDGSRNYWCNFMIGNEEVWLTATTQDFPFKVNVKGSPVQDVFYSLNTTLADNRLLRDSIFTKAKGIMSDPSSRSELKRLVKEMAVIDSLEIQTKKDFIEAHLQTYPAVLELFLVRSSYEKTELASLFLQLSEELKESAYGIKIKNFLGIAKIVGRGDKAFAFTAQDKEGKMHSFPTSNNKFILLDFTKDYCPPCVHSVKEIKEIRTKYEKTLEVISFSPDEKQGWLAGIKRDQPNWLYLRDDKGTAGPVILNYGVQSYPTFVLIDPSGTVVERSAGYSAGSLQKMMKEFLK